MEASYDVVVVGAGPVGLLTAIELTLGGARAVVLERLAAAGVATKALGMGALGIEALQRRGMAAAIAAAEGSAMATIKAFVERSQPGVDRSKFGGHFGGLALLRKGVQREPERRMALVDQSTAEAMLAERARALGIAVRRGCEVTGVAQDAEGVDVAWNAETGGGRIRCAYLVGCDGGRSAIRKMTGFAFPGTAPTLTMYTAIAGVDHPDRLLPIGWHRTSGGLFAYGPFPNRLFMLDFSGPPADREAPVTQDEVEAVLRRVSGADVRVTTLESASRWTDNTRLVDSYRSGRVLLAGDAAHVHSPFGGQGMSLGLCDAANLGWKLAAVLRGEKGGGLLDSYTAERRPVAEAVLANTLAQVAVMRPDPQSGAMRELLARLLEIDDVNRLIGEMMGGLSIRYELGSQDDPVGRLIGDRPVGAGTLYEAMQDGAGVLLDATAGGRATRLVAAIAPGVRCIPVAAGPSLLIRPDSCVAWVGEGRTDGLSDATRRWFGSDS